MSELELELYRRRHGPRAESRVADSPAVLYNYMHGAARFWNRLLFFELHVRCGEQTRSVIKSFIIQLNELFRNFPTS